MKSYEGKIKNAMLIGVLLFLLLPLIQWKMKIIPVKELSGAFVKKDEAAFSKQAWFELSYQKKFEQWFNENFGFRNSCVRIRNQVEFSLYDKGKAAGLIIGKNNYLYEKNYIIAYTGKDFLGAPTISSVASKLKEIQDTLEKRNILLIVALAPGKASFYPEYIPDEFGPPSKKTNYFSYATELKRKNVNMIDFNKWFLQMKPSAPAPLFPKTGIHWSRYGSILALDSIIKYIEHKKKIDLPSIIIKKTRWSDSLMSPDSDLAEGMNLWSEIKPLKMAYFDYIYEDTTNRARISVMAVSDSYFHALFDTHLSPCPFRSAEYCYYCQGIYRERLENHSWAQGVNLPEESTQKDVVIIMATEANLQSLGWGFINESHNYFFKNVVLSDREKKIKKYENAIMTNNDWMQDVLKKAKANGISLDSMVKVDATWMVNEEEKKSGYDQKLKQYEDLIRKDKAWMAEIIKKAKAKGISADSVLRQDAAWQLSEEEKKAADKNPK